MIVRAAWGEERGGRKEECWVLGVGRKSTGFTIHASKPTGAQVDWDPSRLWGASENQGTCASCDARDASADPRAWLVAILVSPENFWVPIPARLSLPEDLNLLWIARRDLAT